MKSPILMTFFVAVAALAQTRPEPPALIRPPVLRPVRDGVLQDVPAELEDQSLARLGLVDVSRKPFGADRTGRSDATRALQRALDFGRRHQMAVYFPQGTYRVSDTLECPQGHDRRADGRIAQEGSRNSPCLLFGERDARRPSRRPVILLAPRSPGYGDPGRPKYVIHFWARNWRFPEDPRASQPNINLNQMLVNIDVTVGEGNPGAVAISHRAAQGSAVQDCTIDARHGLTGLEGGAGAGGGHARVTVLGGKIGLDLRGTQPAPTITGFTLIGQTGTAILNGSRQTLVATGLRIVAQAGGPLIIGAASDQAPHDGQMSIIDSEITFEEAPRGRPNVAISSLRSLYLNNVYVRHATQLVSNPDGSTLAGNPNGWMHIREYAHGARPRPFKGVQYEAPVYVDGKRGAADVIEAAERGSAPPADLQSRHVWDDRFPGWQSPAAANVKAAPYRAKGDSYADDTEALQRAIDEHEIVLLPKGYYRLTRTLRLKPNTKLIGVGQHLSMLLVRGAEGDFADPAHPSPMVLTADERGAATVLAFCGFFVPKEYPGAVALHWRAGGDSFVRAVTFVTSPLEAGAKTPVRNHPQVLISGHGGGRWYNYYDDEDWTFQGPQYRRVLVDGASGPLRFYSCNPEHARAEANFEIRGARGVTFYGLKSEGNRAVLWIHDSDHVRVFGHGGNATAYPGTALFRVENTPNFLIANAVDTPRWAGEGSEDHFAGVGVDPARWHMISDQPGGAARVMTAPLDRPVLYRRGAPREE